MSNPLRYPGFPEESLIRHLRNILIELKKTLQATKDVNLLQEQMEHFINANRKVIWPHVTHSIFCKDEVEKAIKKVLYEFQRYIKDLEGDNYKSSFQDLNEALLMVESMLDRLRESH